MRRILSILTLWISIICCSFGQINTDRVLNIGRNALYFEDYVLSIQYFNEVIAVKPYLAEPYLYRSIAKVYLDDFMGAEADATACIDRNPFLVNAYQVRGIARQNMKNYDGAAADFLEGLSQQPENKSFLRNLAITYALQKDYPKAEAAFDNLIDYFPNEPMGFLNRAQLRMERKDSIGAMQDLNRTIQLDKGAATAYALRAMIEAEEENWDAALSDLDFAIKLEPEQSAYYINRGMVRYNKNNIRGALADYDQAIELDSRSVLPLYNRGLLRAQVGDRNRAIQDFTSVLALEPENSFASYNRALLRDETGDLEGAIADYSAVYEQHPNFFPAVYARAEAKRKLGKSKSADEDYKLAFTIEQRIKKETQECNRRRQQLVQENVANPDSVLMAEYSAQEDADLDDDAKMRSESDKNIKKFNRIMASGMDDSDRRYSSDMRGRVQNHHETVDMQPLFVLSYYEKSDDTRHGIYFEKTLSDFNRASLLSRRLKVVCQEPMLTEAQVQVHFASIDENSRLVGNNTGTLITFFARSLDFMLVQDYQSAIQDLNQVLMRKDNFILAYFNRSVLRFRQLEINDRAGIVTASKTGEEELKNSVLQQTPLTQRQQETRRIECEMCMRDLDKVIELSPTFVYAYYNRAFILAKLNSFERALEDLDKAIELYPDFAEAYYNRGLIRLRRGMTQAGLADLSKAGELGISQAYSVLKRANSD